MANIQRNFVAGRMNKTTDKRLIPNGEYIDALNIRLGSTEKSEVGTIQNSKGNTKLTELRYGGFALSEESTCLGAYEDGANETLYWLIHDPNNIYSPTGKVDLICSYNTNQNSLTYHVISVNDGGGVNTTLNFNPKYLFTGIDLIDGLFFFTNDYNPPRKINTIKTYAEPVSGVDSFSSESILVIKKPPTESPVISLLTTANQDNYLQERFISFAYRYLYEDNEYSATSQFSDIAFRPSVFNFNSSNYLNNGMLNTVNSVEIKFNTGGPLVVGIDLLFKEANGNVIKVIKKLSKENLGYVDNEDQVYVFNNSEIFTILPESEILRLYDNVPRFAKAQTIMGNRLIYGNYIDGYDLIDNNGQPIKLEYNIDLINESIGSVSLFDYTSDGFYSIDTPQIISDSIINIDLGDNKLVEGAFLSIDINFTHADYSGTDPLPSDPSTQEYNVVFLYTLIKSYDSVYELATSDEFINYVGTVLNIQPVLTSCDGYIFTDFINCIISNSFGTSPNAFEKQASGITAINQPVKIISSIGSNIIGLQLPAMKYLNTTSTQVIYEYYKATFVSAVYQEIGNGKSLHSNRGYEVGIVYMDEFNRSSTALLSPESVKYIPCSYSIYKNSIRANIPYTQKPPYWATRYKFVIKPDLEGYNTIYSNIFFTDPNTNSVYFLLEGENSTKVEAGDELIVKADTDGPTSNCVYTTVLEKKSQTSNFLDIPDVFIPSGVYMKINPNNFNTIKGENSIIAPVVLGNFECTAPDNETAPLSVYPMCIPDPANPGQFKDYTVPSGSVIKMNIEFRRVGPGSGNRKCERRIYTLNKTFVSLGSYDNMYEWFNGENIQASLDLGIWEGGDGVPKPLNVYDNTLATSITIPNCATTGPFTPGTNYYRFHRNTTNQELTLVILSGTQSCGVTPDRRSRIITSFEVVRANNLVIFESNPQDALPDIFFEGSQSFPIINGNHQGNIQNQDVASGISAIVDTGLFNCFTFGNGVESYRILDSILGKTFNLGERVTATSAQDFKEADRFAGLTYSGVYNAENNVNKLNEFNLGLLNFKNLEISFGNVEKLYARETDILTLQEDKISYVLTGKNLLSDASGGSALTSVPEVLGTQIARVEEFGISANPESFASYGYDKYFTDAKRGAVIQLKGGNSGQDQLNVVSDAGMRTWFRDLFMTSFNTQKIGGYDPYMNEYVLSSNSIKIPSIEVCSDCGVNKTFYTVKEGEDVSFCTNFGSSVGPVDVDYEVNSVDEFVNIQVLYNGDLYETGNVSTSGTLTFQKNSIDVRTAEIIIQSTVGYASVSIIERCPDALEMVVVQVCLTSNDDAGQFIHNEYRYFEGPYTSPLQSSIVNFTSSSRMPNVSQFSSITGKQGTGAFPADLSTVRLFSNKIGFDDFVFNIDTNKFKYLRTNTIYGNNDVDINLLLNSSNDTEDIVSSGAPNTYYADFTMPIGDSKYLYLIYDYREIFEVSLCYSNVDGFDACCVACQSNPIDACYDLDSVVDACCDCNVESFEIDLCVASTGCLACTECI
jgi:hypothetical protein